MLASKAQKTSLHAIVSSMERHIVHSDFGIKTAKMYKIPYIMGHVDASFEIEKLNYTTYSLDLWLSCSLCGHE